MHHSIILYSFYETVILYLHKEATFMSLKIQRQDNLESLFDKFAIDPKNPAKVELKPSETEKKPDSDTKESKLKK